MRGLAVRTWNRPDDRGLDQPDGNVLHSRSGSTGSLRGFHAHEDSPETSQRHQKIPEPRLLGISKKVTLSFRRT